MPTSTIHVIVSRKIAKKYPKLDNYNYYLGSIAPDSVNFYGFASKEERWEAHIRDKDLTIWKKNIIGFYNSNKEKYEESFLKGYITHIMTDIIFDELFYLDVTLPMKKIGKVETEAHLYMLDEMKSYGNRNEDFTYVKEVLNNNNSTFNIRNINEKLMNNWKNKVINEELPDIKVQFITDKIVSQLALKVEEELINNKII